MTIEQLIKKLSVFRIFSKKAMSTVEGLVIMIKALLVNNDEWGEKFINSDDTLLIFNDKWVITRSFTCNIDIHLAHSSNFATTNY